MGDVGKPISSSEISPKSLYPQRREFLQIGGGTDDIRIITIPREILKSGIGE